MKTKFFSILLSFLYIRSSNCSEWILIEEVVVEDQYFEFKYLGNRNAGVQLGATDPHSVDEFVRLGPSELEYICSHLKNSNVYQRIPLTAQFPQATNLEKVIEEQKMPYQYVFKSLKSQFGKIIGTIPVFPCQTHKSRMYWLTHGYMQSGIFLLREVDGGEAVTFVGKSVLVPKKDEKYAQGELLDAYFLHSVQKAVQDVHQGKPVKNSVNPFANSALFHICCMVHAAKLNQRSGAEENATMNYANSDPVTPKLPPILTKSAHEINLRRAIGCAVNRKEENEIDFYVRADAQNENAIFVLDHKNSDKNALIVAGLVYGIPQQDQSAFYYL